MEQWPDPGLEQYADMTPERVRTVLFEAVSMAHSHFKEYPAWLFTRQVFGVGPKVGLNLCLHAGLDPNLSVFIQRQHAIEQRGGAGAPRSNIAS